MTRVDSGYTTTPTQNNQQASHFSKLVSNAQTKNTGTPDNSYTRIEDHRLTPNHPANAQTESLQGNTTQTEEDISAEDMETLKNGTENEQLELIAKLLKQGITPENLEKIIEDTTKSEKLSEAVSDIATIIDPNASIKDKAFAVADLATKFTSTFDFVKKFDPALKSSVQYAKYIDSMLTLINPETSAEDRVMAGFEAMKALKEAGVSLGEISSFFEKFKMANPAFRLLDDVATIINSAYTLADEEKSVKEKVQAAIDGAEAAYDLATNTLNLPGDFKAVADLLERNGVPDEAINAMRLASDPELGEAFKAAASKLQSNEALTALEKELDALGTNTDAKKALLNIVENMDDGVAEKILLKTIDGKTGAEILGTLAKNLDGPALEALGKIAGSFDESSMTSMIRMFNSVLNEPGGKALINTMLPLFAKADGKMLSNTFKLYNAVISKIGMTPQTALKLLKGVGKIIPIVGAGMAAIDAYQMGSYAIDKSLPQELRILAGFAAQLNAGDVALSIAEPFIAEAFGIPVAVDLSLAAAEVVMDVIVSDQVEKAKADPNYSTPGWVKSFATAVSFLSPLAFFATLF